MWSFNGAIKGLLVTTTLPLAAGAIDMNNAAGLRPDGNANLEGLDLDGMGSAPYRSPLPTTHTHTHTCPFAR